jgi:ABC-type lipoprotein export system ATPase subunit
MTRTKQLFLDETINNIDQETISHVADMIQDYTKMNDISLYLVTHSSQLQSMDIWTDVITPIHVSS